MIKTNKTNKKLQAYACVLLIMTLIMSSMIVSPNAASSVTRTLYVGNTLTLTYSNKAVKWETSNKSIAKLSKTSATKSIVVTGVKKGSATIKAKSGSKVLASCVVNVKSNTLSINKSTASVKVGNSVTLTATSTASASNIKWSSSDSSIATVSSKNGKTITVKGKKAGTATITAKTVDGIKKTCKVTVKKASTSTSTSSSSTTTNPTSVINKYFTSNTQYTKISDGNGSFDKLNGHAATQQATYTAEGYEYKGTLSVATNGKYQYIWHNGSTFGSISWKNAISLSFTNNTFQTGETCGVLRVLNCSIPNCKYTWSSSNSSVVGIQTMNPDISAIHILAKASGSSTITCKISFPNGETKTLKSIVNVSDTIGSKIPNGTVNMNTVMERIATAYRSNKNVNWIPDVISTQQASAFGNTALGSYSAYEITYPLIEEETMENIYSLNKRFQHNPQEYIIAYASETFSDVYFMVEYMGHNDNGIQMAQVGVLSIPTVK